MISSKKAVARWAFLLSILGLVGVVVAALLMQSDWGSSLGQVQAATGGTHLPRECPFDENRTIQPVYEWSENSVTGIWSLTITPDSSVQTDPSLAGFSGEPVDHGWQAFYEFGLYGGRSTLIDRQTFSVSLPSVTYGVTRVLGRRITLLDYRYTLEIWMDGRYLCRIEANQQAIVPVGLNQYLAQAPTLTPTRRVRPTNTPDCPSQVLPQEDIDALEMWVRPVPSGGGWQLEVLWNRFTKPHPDTVFPIPAYRYRLNTPGLVSWLSPYESREAVVLKVVDWRRGVPDPDQTYEVRLGIYGSDSCLWGERVVEFQFPALGILDPVSCDGGDPIEVVTWGYWNINSDLEAYVRFGLVDWAEYYLVQFDWGDVVEVVPTSEDLAAGEMILAHDQAYTHTTVQNGYAVWVMPMSTTCMGTRVKVDCGEEACAQMQVATPAPTLSTIGACSGRAQAVAVLSAAVGADGKHSASVNLSSTEASSHFDVKIVYRGGVPVVRRVTAADAGSAIALGKYDGPPNLGEYWMMTAQARGWDESLGCGGPWGPISAMRLEGGSSGVSPGQVPGQPVVNPVTARSPTPTRPAVLPGDPIDWPDPVDFRTWKDRNPSNDPGHYGWCYSGRYNDKMDDYYASVSEFAASYEQVLRDAGVTKIRKEVNDAVDEAFEDPEEFCSRVGFFGFIRFALAWLSGAVFSLMAVSGVILILVRSAGGDSPNTQVWVKQVFVGLVVATVVVAVVWIVFEILVGVLFGVGVDAIPQATTGGVIAPAWRGFSLDQDLLSNVD